MNIIFGAGGFAREVGWLLNDIAKHQKNSSPIEAFVASDNAPNAGLRIHGVEVLRESDFFSRFKTKHLKAYIAVGSPKLRETLYSKISNRLEHVEFPSAAHPSVCMDLRENAVRIGRGSIICAGSILTTDIEIGDFVNINLNCTIGHDVKIDDFSTISPGVHISGGVRCGSFCFAGTGAVFLENINVPQNTVVGAGATVIKSIVQSGTYIGTPARLRP